MSQTNQDLPDQAGSLDYRGHYVPFYPSAEENMSFWERMWRHPWVTAGALTTAGILGAGIWTIKTGNSALGQKLMRARVAAQFTTVCLLLVASGVIGFTGTSETKPLPAAIQPKKQQDESV